MRLTTTPSPNLFRSPFCDQIAAEIFEQLLKFWQRSDDRTRCHARAVNHSAEVQTTSVAH